MNKSYAVYKGEVYEARSSGDKINLILHKPKDGFIASLVRENYFKKSVSKKDVNEFYSLRKTGVYKNLKVAIIDESETEFLLYGSNHQMPSLGFETLSRGEYRKWVNKGKVDDVREEKQSYL